MRAACTSTIGAGRTKKELAQGVYRQVHLLIELWSRFRSHTILLHQHLSLVEAIYLGIDGRCKHKFYSQKHHIHNTQLMTQITQLLLMCSPHCLAQRQHADSCKLTGLAVCSGLRHLSSKKPVCCGANLDFCISLPLEPVNLNLHVKPADQHCSFRHICLDLPCLCIASVSQALTGLMQIVHYTCSTDF